MSKNLAWSAYNETVRGIDETYAATVKPLRDTLNTELAKIEKKFVELVQPLLAKQQTEVDAAKKTYSDKVMEAQKERHEATTRAHNVLKAELDAAPRQEKKTKKQPVKA